MSRSRPAWLAAAALALGPWAGATELLGPGPSELHPLLLGKVAEEGGPLGLRMDHHATRLLELVQGGVVPAGAADRYLRGLVEAPAHPLDAPAALALARLMTEPALARRLAEEEPRLPGSILRAAARVEAGSPYRGVPTLDAGGLAELAEWARGSRALRDAFDAASRPDLEVGGLYFKDGALVSEGTLRHKAARRTAASAYYGHPAVAGAVIERFREPVPMPVFNVSLTGPGEAQRAAALDQAASWRLAEAGAGPRHLGLGVVGEGQIRPPLTHVVAVKESVYGASVHDLIGSRAFGLEERRLVLELLDRLAARRLAPAQLSPDNILIGRTAAEPERRAYLVDAGEVYSSPFPRERLRAVLAARAAFDSLRPDYLDGQYLGTTSGYAPLDRILDSGVEHSRQRGLRDRLKQMLTDALNLLGKTRFP